MATADVQTPFAPSGLDAAGRQAPHVSVGSQEAKFATGDVQTTLNYFKDNEDGSPPAPSYVDRPETYNRPFVTHPVTVRDLRGREADFSLDRQGFQIVKHVSAEQDFLDDAQIKAVYYPETEQLLKDTTGASRIFIFDHTIRREAPGLNPVTPDGSRNRLLRGPVQRVHIDQSYAASLTRVPHHLPEEAEALLKGRVQIINVWRPIRTVRRDPLAVAEADSVAEADLVPVGLIYPNRKGETLSVRHNPAHRWWHKSGMEPGEALLIKCFDSKTDGRARRVPHTAFVDPRAEEGLPARQSIEVRALVFHPNDQE